MPNSPNSLSSTQDIKDRLAVETLVGEYLKLNRAGVNFKALCPFHTEKTPSFMVSPERRSWHCFGCDKGGDIFTFVMEMEGLEFKEALKLLAKKAGVELPAYRGQQEKTDKSDRLYQINELAAKFFQQKLKGDSGGGSSSASGSKETEVARQELTRRKVDDLTRDTFLIGLAPADWESLSKYLIQKGFKEQEIATAGLGISRPAPKRGIYDRFRNRLMFPIVDVVGRIIGFSGRALDPNEKAGKYINSPETPIYHKGRVLYALNLAKTEIRKRDFVILVEGQMDAVSSHRVGVKNVVATSGTALTENHLQLLKRYTNNLVLAFDVDVAGASATKRGIDLAIASGFNVKVARMTSGVDPDDLCREDPKKWGSAINQSEGIIDYYLRQTSEGRDITKVETKKAIARAVLPEIARLTDEIEKSHYLQRLSELVNVEEAVLRSAIDKKYRASQSSAPATKPEPAHKPRAKASTLQIRLARLLALKLSGEYAHKINDAILVSLKVVAAPAVQEVLPLLSSQKSVTQITRELEKIQPELMPLINKELFLLEQSQEETNLDKEVKELVTLIVREGLKQELKDLGAQAKQADATKAADLQKLFAQKAKQLAELE